jgi:porin
MAVVMTWGKTLKNWRNTLALYVSLHMVLSLGALGAESDPNTETSNPAGADSELTMGTAASIRNQFEVDSSTKDYKLKIPVIDTAFSSWGELRSGLAKEHGFRPNISATHVYQKTTDSVGPEDSAAGYELVVDGTWTFAGRDTTSPTTMGFEFLYRDFTSDIPPVALFTQAGTLYPSTVAFSEVDPTVGQLWIQKKFDNRFGFQAGKLFPLAYYDYFPLKNFRTDFMDAIHAATFVIPLPDRGLGSYVMYRPTSQHYLRLGVHDANADAEEFDFDVFDDGELFSILELGWNPGLMPRIPGRPPMGDVHISLWHQDERDHDKVAEAWGFVVSAYQKMGRFLPFVRYGYADSDSEFGLKDATPIEHMVNAGVAIDALFRQQDDRLGIGFTWSRPIDDMLDDQEAIDLYYRIQLSPRIAVTPTLEFVFDPVRNTDEDNLTIWGIRTRFAF